MLLRAKAVNWKRPIAMLRQAMISLSQPKRRRPIMLVKPITEMISDAFSLLTDSPSSELKN